MTKALKVSSVCDLKHCLQPWSLPLEAIIFNCSGIFRFTALFLRQAGLVLKEEEGWEERPAAKSV